MMNVVEDFYTDVVMNVTTETGEEENDQLVEWLYK